VNSTEYELRCVGDNSYGQLGKQNDDTGVIDPSIVLNSEDVMHGILPEFDCGDSFCCFTHIDTLDLYCVGKNDYGQLGIGNTIDTHEPIKILSNITHVSTGKKHACAINRNSDLYCWGLNTAGQSNYKDQNDKILKPTLIDSNMSFVEVAATHTCGVFKNGTVSCWGSNYYGQLGNYDPYNEDNKYSHIFKITNNVGDVEKMSCSEFHCCAIENKTYWANTLKCWGSNDHSQINNDGGDKEMNPVKVDILESHSYKIISLSLANRHTCIALDNGNVYCWGDNTDGYICGLDKDKILTPTRLNIQDVLSVRTTNNRIMFLKKNGKLWSCGQGTHGVLGTGDETTRYEITESDVLCRGTPTQEPTTSPTRSPTIRPSQSPSQSPTTSTPSTSPTTDTPSTSPIVKNKKEDSGSNNLMIALVAAATTIPIIGTSWALYREYKSTTTRIKYTPLIDY
jgi:alpha-tubulin suppressor-like RCC1 family protein